MSVLIKVLLTLLIVGVPGLMTFAIITDRDELVMNVLGCIFGLFILAIIGAGVYHIWS